MSLPSSLSAFTLAEARDALKAKTISSRELTDALLKSVEASRGRSTPLSPRRRSGRWRWPQASDMRIGKGEGGALEGLPLAIKDLFCTKGVRTTAGSRILGNFVPPYESTVTQNLWNAGAVMLGKTNMDEFAMGSSNETSAFGSGVQSLARQEQQRQSGAGRFVRRFGCRGRGRSLPGRHRHRHGRFDPPARRRHRHGRPQAHLWPLLALRHRRLRFVARPGRAHDQDGARRRHHAAASMASVDPKDSTSVDIAVPDYEKQLEGGIKGLRVGIPEGISHRWCARRRSMRLWEKGAEWLKAQGAEIVEVSLPHTKYALPTYYIVAPAEASSNLARYDGVRFGHRAKGVSRHHRAL